MSIHTNQQLTRLHKITVISGITLQAHFSLGKVKFDTLSNLLLTLATGRLQIALVLTLNTLLYGFMQD